MDGCTRPHGRERPGVHAGSTMQAGAPGRSVFHAGSHDKWLRHFHSTKMRSLTQCGAKANAARCDDRCSAVQRPMQRTAFFQPISPACLHKGMNCPARQPPHSSGIKLFEIRSRLAWAGQSSPYYPSTALHLCPQEPLCPHPREQAGMHDTPPGVPRHLEKLWSGAPFLSSSPNRASQPMPPQQPGPQLLSLHHSPVPPERPPRPAPTAAPKKK